MQKLKIDNKLKYKIKIYTRPSQRFKKQFDTDVKNAHLGD